MGACSSKKVVAGTELQANAAEGYSKAAKVKDKKLDDAMKQEMAEDKLELKLLLLGAGESGKTTFRKQMRIIHSNKEQSFTPDEIRTFTKNVYHNVFDCLLTMVSAIPEEKVGFDPLPPEAAEAIELIEVISVEDDPPETYNGELSDKCKVLWESSAMQYVFNHRNELYLSNVSVNLDSMPYLMKHITRIMTPDYVPSQQDILVARSQTIMVEEECFEFHKNQFRIIDVGGQRNERKKWLPLFDSVTAFLFFASLVEYDQVLAEAKEENRMRESLQIFGAVANYHFTSSPPPILLFLNKKDLFEEKIATIDLKIAFSDYTGGCDYDQALEFIKKKYLEHNYGKRKVYIFVTCATNTKNIQFVFKACSDVILKENLKNSGMYAMNATGEQVVSV